MGMLIMSFKVNVCTCLGFQLFGSYIKGQVFHVSFSFFRIPLVGRIFFIIKHDFQMLTVAITRPPFTCIMCSFFLCNSIYMKISSQPSLMHYIYMHLFLVDQFLPLTSFNLFVQQSFLWIYTFMTLYVMTLHVTIISCFK